MNKINLYNMFEKFIYILFFLFNIIIIYSLITIGPDFINKNQLYKDALKNQLFSNGMFFVLIILFFFFFFYFIYRKYKKIKNNEVDYKIYKKSFYRNLFIISQLFLMFQFFLIFFVGMVPIWDPIDVCATAREIINGTVSHSYLEVNPNNMGIVFFIKYILLLSYYVNTSPDGILFFIAIIITNLSISLSSILVFLITQKKFWAYFTFVLGVLFIGISGWSFTPYTDTYSMFIPILTIFLYYLFKSKKDLKDNRALFFHYCTIFGLPILGGLLKAQSYIVLIAILLTELFLMISNLTKKNRTIILKRIVLMFISISILFVLKNIIFIGMRNNLKIKDNSNREKTIAHYLMMGLNEKDLGICSYKDVKFTESLEGLPKSQRMKENYKEYIRRLNSMSINDKWNYFLNKTRVNFAHGNLWWGMEALFSYKGFYPKRYFQNNLSPFYKEIREYYNFYNPSKYKYQYNIQQFIWLSYILFSCLLSLIYLFKKKKESSAKDIIILVIILTILGAIIFQTIFEARSRYFIMFVPIMMSSLVLGIRSSINVLNKKQLT